MKDDRHYDEQNIYQIRVQGILDAGWSDWFDRLTIIPQVNGETLLTGVVVDQSALYGLLNKMRDIGLTLLSINRAKNNPQQTIGRSDVPDQGED